MRPVHLRSKNRPYGADHPEVAISLNGLVELLRATNRPEEAEMFLQRAVAIAQRAMEPDRLAERRIAGVRSFFERAGCSVANASVDGLTIDRSPDPLSEYTPIHVCLVLSGSPERSAVSALAGKAKTKNEATVAFLVYADPPKASARAEFAVARSDSHVSILPLELHAVETRLCLVTLSAGG